MRITAATAATIVIALLTAAPAIGQPRAFVEGRLLADYDTVQAPTMGDATAAAAGIAAGFFLNSRWSVRFDMELPGWHVDEWSQPVFARQPDGRWIVTGSEVVQHRRRMVGYSGMVARHLKPVGRVQFALLAGVTAMAKSDGYTWLAVPVGAEASVRVARWMSIVPTVRLYIFPGPTDTAQSVTRAGVGIRCGF